MALRRHLLADRDRADAAAADAELARISGFDLFMGQGIDAFEIFTGHILATSILDELETRMRVLERPTPLLTRPTRVTSTGLDEG
jgi:hypothetical protein